MLSPLQLSVRTKQDRYLLNGEQRKGTILVEGSPHSYVMAQMVDHAVLALNDRTTLTPERVQASLI